MPKNHTAPNMGAEILHNEKINYQISPVRNSVIEGMCIDPEGTTIHEDSIRVTVLGNRTQIDVAVIVPPLDLYSPERLQKSLVDLLTNSGRSFFNFFEHGVRLAASFQEDDERPALVATYVLLDNKLIQEDIDCTLAKGIMVSTEEYSDAPEFEEILEVLRKLLTTKPDVKKRIFATLESNFPKRKKDKGFLIAFIATQLFNDTAVAAARKRKIPFIKRPSFYSKHGYFTLNHSGSVFNRSLRDPCGFINASNLFAHFKKEPFPFTRKKLKTIVPFGNR